MIEFSHNNFLHSQVERSIQYVLGLEPIELLQPSTQLAVADSSSEKETKNETEQPTCPTHRLLTHVGGFVYLANSNPFRVICLYYMVSSMFVADDRGVYCSAHHGCLGAE